jgi:hypothetical protein
MRWQEVASKVDNEVTTDRNHMDFKRKFSPLIKRQSSRGEVSGEGEG